MEAMRRICIAHSKAWVLSQASFSPGNPNTQRKVQPCKEEVQYALFYNTDGQQLMHSATGTGETSGASGQPTASDPSSRQSCFPLPCCQTDRGIPGVGWLSHTHLVKQKTFVDFTLVRADDF